MRSLWDALHGIREDMLGYLLACLEAEMGAFGGLKSGCLGAVRRAEKGGFRVLKWGLK